MVKEIQLDDYTIFVGEAWDKLSDILEEKGYTKIFVLTDENTSKYCLPILKEKIKEDWTEIKVESGELHKDIATCQQIWSAMMSAKADRHALMINLGGGVLGDMGGFCASTYKRGIDFIQIPTTLLSQVDASIGGKLGIDFMDIKNSIGLFNNPVAVFCNPSFFQTLAKSQIRSGFAEMLKHALIQDAEQWAVLVQIQNLSKVDWLPYLSPSLGIKRDVVAEDPFEKGLRKALNFGHTIGHAIESFLLKTDKPLLHGEAIAFGMLAEAYISTKQTNLSQEDFKAIQQAIENYYGELQLSPKDFPALVEYMYNDKKNKGRSINCTLLKSIGDCVVDCVVEEDLILESLGLFSKQ